MKKVVCALATLAFIGSINVVSADDSTRFRLNGNSIYDQPYGDRNEFPCPDRLGSCTMTDSDYRSTRKGQSLEVFDTLYEAKQHLNFKWFRGITFRTCIHCGSRCITSCVCLS